MGVDKEEDEEGGEVVGLLRNGDMCSVENNVSLMNVDGCDCDSNVESTRKWICI